jgi:NAD(P)H-dependent flavin oxidoreductase YrpB (nitropropane dioxygenase family)
MWWSHRAWRPAATAGDSMLPRPRPRWSDFALIPAVVDAVRIAVVATGGIADARGVAAALTFGASAAPIGTGFLRCPEAQIAPAWADAIGRTLPEETTVSRVFSGRADRLCPRGDRTRGAETGAASGPARSDNRYAQCETEAGDIERI